MLGPYILLVQSLIVVSVTPLLLFLYPCNPRIVIIVPLHYYCQVGQDYIVAPLGLHYGPMDSYIQKGGFVNCIIQELCIYVMYWRFSLELADFYGIDTSFILFLYPCNPRIFIIVPLHYYCQVIQDYIVTPWTPIYIKEVFSFDHPRIFHLCNVKDVSPSKWLIYKAFISLFFYFWRCFHKIWYQSFGFQGFDAPNRSSWNFHYNFFSTKVQKLKSLGMLCKNFISCFTIFSEI